MYQLPLAGGLAAGSGAAAAALPANSSSAVVRGAHQVLAFTGMAVGAYVAIALLLILAGLILRRAATTGRKPS